MDFFDPAVDSYSPSGEFGVEAAGGSLALPGVHMAQVRLDDTCHEELDTNTKKTCVNNGDQQQSHSARNAKLLIINMLMA